MNTTITTTKTFIVIGLRATYLLNLGNIRTLKKKKKVSLKAKHKKTNWETCPINIAWKWF